MTQAEKKLIIDWLTKSADKAHYYLLMYNQKPQSKEYTFWGNIYNYYCILIAELQASD